MTTKGELLALFVSEEIPGYLSPVETIKRLKEQDAFISVSHPFDQRRNGWSIESLIEIVPMIDAIEVFNARCGLDSMNKQAAMFATSASFTRDGWLRRAFIAGGGKWQDHPARILQCCRAAPSNR